MKPFWRTCTQIKYIVGSIVVSLHLFCFGIHPFSELNYVQLETQQREYVRLSLTRAPWRYFHIAFGVHGLEVIT